jgi:segregation and condensation protein A
LDLSPAAVRAAPRHSPFLEGDDFLVVALDDFQGPLDLLLHLIRQQDIDIFDIPISRITEQFLAAVHHIRASELDNAGEFLEMAATLVRIKAQMLLPRRAEDEDRDPRAELVRRLLEYEQIREISQRLRSAEAERARRFSKGWVEPRPRPAPEDTPLETTWEEVFEVALQVRMPDPRDTTHRITTRPVAMEDKIVLILGVLREEARVRFSRLLRGVEELQGRMHAVMTLLASLELSRRRDLSLRQVRPFSELWLYRREEGEEDMEVPAETAGEEESP